MSTPNTPGAMPAGLLARLRLMQSPAHALRSALDRLSPRQRQFALLGAILSTGVGILWFVFAFTASPAGTDLAKVTQGQPSGVTNIGVMPAGSQVNPLDQWVGTAGRKLAQYETEREEQGRLNKDRQGFESKTMQRFAELEQRLTSVQQAPQVAAMPPLEPSAAPPAPGNMPPTASLPPPPLPAASALPALPVASPAAPAPEPAVPAAPVIARVTLVARSGAGAADTGSAAPPGSTGTPQPAPKTVATFLPVSFARGTLLGGLDAPTGGQSQANPPPVLIRLSGNSVLPNRFRGEYRDCFVIAAGYGDISSERAYLRTENLSCVRADGATLEVRIQGSVYGEVGMRGRLVTKQGQMLANALLAGVVSGLGQGLSSANTTYSTTALGTTASTDSNADAYRSGLGAGVGKALDRLAQYYIKLAENTFPVIEVDAGREIDVVITKGVRIDVAMNAETTAAAGAATTPASPQTRYLEASDDGNY